MLEDQIFQNEKTARKAALKAERDEKKKEDSKKPKRDGFARRRSKTSAKRGTGNEKKSKRSKKQNAFQKRLLSPYDPSLPTATTPKKD